MFSLAFVCLFVCLAELGKDNRLSRFSQNSVERWHKGQGRNDSASSGPQGLRYPSVSVLGI